MADEEEKVVAEKKSGNNNLIVIIGVVLIVISLALSAVSLITIMGINKKIDEPEQSTVMESTDIPLMEISTVGFAEDFLFRFEDEESDILHSVVVNINVGVHNTAKDGADVIATLGTSETVLRDGIAELVASKGFESFQSPESMDLIKEEIKMYLQQRLQTDSIIDIYFTNFITSSK